MFSSHWEDAADEEKLTTVVSEPRQTRTIAATNIAMWFSHRARELTARIQGQLPAPIISLQNGFQHSFIFLLIVNLYRYAIALSDCIHRRIPSRTSCYSRISWLSVWLDGGTVNWPTPIHAAVDFMTLFSTPRDGTLLMPKRILYWAKKIFFDFIQSLNINNCHIYVP